MSANYYKARPEVFQSKFYGFKKVTKAELDDIVNRMQKKTFCKELYDNDLKQSKPSPQRPASSVCMCKKAIHDKGALGCHGHWKRVDDRTLYRIVRRLRKPTISRLVATGRINYDTYMNNQNEHVIAKPMSELPVEEQQERLKSRMRILRQTTSSRGKRVTECPFCDDPAMHRSCVFDLDYSEDRIASSEEVESIISRVSSSTHASGGGVTPCSRSISCNGHRHGDNLPLISGLKRSKNVDEIVSRLFTPTKCRPVTLSQPASRPSTRPPTRPATAPARPISAPAKLGNKQRTSKQFHV